MKTLYILPDVFWIKACISIFTHQIMSASVETGSSNTASNSNNKNNKNRNRNRNKNKNKTNNSKSDQEQGSSNSTSTSNVNSNTNQARPLKSKSNSKNSSKSKSNNNKTNKSSNKNHALLKEFEKLLPIINPITINGILSKSLSTEPIQFIDSILSDQSNNDEIFMTFFIKPSDPNFPYDLELLSLTLCIPQTYPNKLPSPTIMVLNDDIPRGFSVNIEIGFKKIVETVLENRNARKGQNAIKDNNKSDKKNDKKTSENIEGNEDDGVLKIEVVGGNDLVGMISTLDVYLEKFLSMEKKDTIKLVKVMNKKKEADEKKKLEEERVKKEEEEKKKKKEHDELISSALDPEKFKLRTYELEKFRQRLRGNSIRVFKDNSQGIIYKLFLLFKDDNLTLEFDDCDQIVIEKLYIKLTVPKEYLNNPKKFIKLVVDMSNSYNIDLVNSITDPNVRLIFGKLINNLSRNFDIFSADVSSINCENPDVNSDSFWTIMSQLNFFIHNIQKFMNEKAEFQSWYNANKEMNKLLIDEYNNVSS